MENVPNPGRFGDLPNRDDRVRITVETPGRHLRAFVRTPDPDKPDRLVAIARLRADGSGSWVVSWRGGRHTVDNELAARALMLEIGEGESE